MNNALHILDRGFPRLNKNKIFDHFLEGPLFGQHKFKRKGAEETIDGSCVVFATFSCFFWALIILHIHGKKKDQRVCSFYGGVALSHRWEFIA